MAISATILLSGLGAAVCWGISGFMQAKVTRTHHPLACAFLANAIGTTTFALIYLVVPWPAAGSITLSGASYAVAGGAVITIGSLAIFKALAIGPASLVSPLSSTYPLVTLALVTVAYGARVQPPRLLGVILVVAGVALATHLIGRGPAGATQRRGPLLALVTALSWGIGYPLVGQAINRLGWATATLIEVVAIVVTFGLILPFMRTARPTQADLTAALRSPLLGTSALIQLGGALALNGGLAAAHQSSAVITALSACYPLLTMFLVRRYLEERVATAPLIGALVSVLGIIVLTLG